MKRSEIAVLQRIISDPRSAVPVKQLVGVRLSSSTVDRAVSTLSKRGLIKIFDVQVSLAETAKASMLVKIAKRYDIEKIFRDAAEEILPLLTQPRNLDELQKLTHLSVPTTYRTLDRMMQSGAVVKNERREYRLNPSDNTLGLYVSLLREETMSKAGMPRNEEILFTDGVYTIKAVPKGQAGESGSLTAFSAFPRFGMDLRAERDYYATPAMPIGAEDALVHALVVSKNKLERTHCAIFYAINRDKLDLEKVRQESERFKVISLWINLERFVLGLTVTAGLFLNWDEFAERCRLYEVDPAGLQPPRAHPKLFEKIGHSLEPRGEGLDAYLIGGENMRIKQIKQSTKDVDLAVKNKRDYLRFADALQKLGYRSIGRSEMTSNDRKLNPSGIFVLENSPRVDVFTKVICNKMQLTKSMEENSVSQRFGDLDLHLLSNEDVFLLKTITDREADDVDMIEIVKASSGFGWQRLFDTMLEQERITGEHYCFAVLDSLDLIRESLQMKIPIYRRLLVHTTDEAILRVLRRSKSWLSVRELHEGIGEIGESELRNRLQALASKGKILKKKMGGVLVFKGKAE